MKVHPENIWSAYLNDVKLLEERKTA